MTIMTKNHGFTAIILHGDITSTPTAVQTVSSPKVLSCVDPKLETAQGLLELIDGTTYEHAVEILLAAALSRKDAEAILSYILFYQRKTGWYDPKLQIIRVPVAFFTTISYYIKRLLSPFSTNQQPLEVE